MLNALVLGRQPEIGICHVNDDEDDASLYSLECSVEDSPLLKQTKYNKSRVP